MIHLEGNVTFMKKETTNVIAIRSKKWITDSLLKLMKEKDFEKITVKEIIKDADLTRQTFYRNFSSKEDVLKEYIEALYEECFREINELEDKNLFKILTTYFYYWHKNKDFLMLVCKSKFNYNIEKFYAPYMLVLLEGIENYINTPVYTDAQINYIKEFILGGLINLKMSWSINNYKETPEELAHIVISLFGKS